MFALIIPLGELSGGRPDQGLPGYQPGVGIPGFPTHPIAPGGPPPGVWPNPPVGIWPNPPGGGGRPDQGLPPFQGRPDQGLPSVPPPQVGIPVFPGQLPSGPGGGVGGGHPSHPISGSSGYVLIYHPVYGWVLIDPDNLTKPDQGLPGSQPGVDNSLPGGVPPGVDNELPETPEPK